MKTPLFVMLLLGSALTAPSVLGQEATQSEREAMYYRYLEFPSHVRGGSVQRHWMADGSGMRPPTSKIAFASDRDGNFEIYVMNADGSSATNLTNRPAWDGDTPCWSPDGSKIAFVSDRDGNKEIYVMNADGSNVKRLTTNKSLDGHPNW